MLGDLIGKHLKQTHRKREFLCALLDVSPSTVTAMLNGERKITAEEYFKICGALGVSLDTFKPSDTAPTTEATA